MSVLVVEDDVRLHGIIEELIQPQVRRLVFTRTIAEARRALRAERFALALVDLSLPDGAGAELIAECGRQTRCLVITTASTREAVLGALRAGAWGYLVKEDLVERLPIAVSEVRLGGMPVSPAAATFVLERFRLAPPVDPTRAPTPKERETLSFLARGLTYAQIADARGVSINTVRSHVSSAYEKLQASNMAEAVMIALREGWIEP